MNNRGIRETNCSLYDDECRNEVKIYRYAIQTRNDSGLLLQGYVAVCSWLSGATFCRFRKGSIGTSSSNWLQHHSTTYC